MSVNANPCSIICSTRTASVKTLDGPSSLLANYVSLDELTTATLTVDNAVNGSTLVDRIDVAQPGIVMHTNARAGRLGQYACLAHLVDDPLGLGK